MKTVAVVPSRGTKRYLEILLPYLKHANMFDEIRVWLNPEFIADPEYMEGLQDEGITIQLEPLEITWTRPFYKECQDPDTVYVKLDEDMCYIHPGALQRLVECRKNNPAPFVISANVVNNGLCSYIHQQIGAIDKKYGELTFVADDPITYRNATFTAHQHRTFLDAVNNDKVDEFYFDNYLLVNYDYFSVNCITFFGKDLVQFDTRLTPDEQDEKLFTQVMPKEQQRPCMLCGDALIVHHSYYTQRSYLDTQPDILTTYKLFSEMLNK